VKKKEKEEGCFWGGRSLGINKRKQNKRKKKSEKKRKKKGVF
jgi:hypothetical protein